MVRGKTRSNSNSGGKASAKSNLCALGQGKCKKPTGKISWVCCDGCEEWYHCSCVSVDPKEAEEIIYHCMNCKPGKEKEFKDAKEAIKAGLEEIMKTHSLYSTSAIARKCFATKAKYNDFHADTKGVPVSLKELSEKLQSDITTMDHFKQSYSAMIGRMEEFLKPDQKTEISKVLAKLDKLTTNAVKKVPAKKAAPTKNNVRAKRGKKPVEEEEKMEVDEVPDGIAEDIKDEKVDVEQEVDVKNEPEAVKEEAAAVVAQPEISTSAAPEQEVKRNCEMCEKEINPPLYQCVDEHLVCSVCLHGSERGYCPICRKESGKNRRPKKHDKWSTVKLKDAEDKPKVEAPEVKEETRLQDQEESDKTEEVKEKETAEVQPPAVVSSESITQPTVAETKQPSRKRRGKNIDDSESKPKKPSPQKKTTKVEVPETKTVSMAKTADSVHLSSKLETLVSSTVASAPLSKSVLLPTSPIVQSILPKPQVAPVQAFQLRPTTPASTSSGLQITGVPGLSSTPTQLRMQNSTTAQPARPQGLQFYKIVEGKPVQIGSGDATKLPTSPLPIQTTTGVGPKLLYVRSPAPSSTAASSLSPTRPQVSQKQIILLSNKGPGKSTILTPVSPTNTQGIVKIVSTGGTGEPGKIILNSNAARLAPQLQGPVLLRPVSSLPSPPLTAPQLPSVPLPRAALTTTSSGVTDKAQTLLPKSPLPPAQIKTTAPAKLVATTSAPTTASQKAPTSTGITTTTSSTTTTSTPAPQTTTRSDSVVNKAFVWKNSDKTQFKLSARFNFDLFREYQKNHPNKDIRFALASIITEDKSNEFSFHLSQQKENNESFWQLGVRAKNVSEHVWHLKVKVDPPVFLVNNGTFKQNLANFRIPKDVSDKAVVDYELLLMGKASALGANAAAKNRGKKVAVSQVADPPQQ